MMNVNAFLRVPSYWRLLKNDRLALLRQKRHLQQLVDITRQVIEQNPAIYQYYRIYLIDLLNQINEIRIELEILCG